VPKPNHQRETPILIHPSHYALHPLYLAASSLTRPQHNHAIPQKHRKKCPKTTQAKSKPLGSFDAVSKPDTACSAGLRMQTPSQPQNVTKDRQAATNYAYKTCRVCCKLLHLRQKNCSVMAEMTQAEGIPGS
jgi:hypothetical protein